MRTTKRAGVTLLIHLMYFNYKYRLYPSNEQEGSLAQTLEICRQLYNHFLNRLNTSDDIPSEYSEKNTLPDLKQEWTELNNVHSKVLQTVVERLYANLTSLSAKKQSGLKVGALRYKSQGWYKSFTYSQSGFKLIDTDTRRNLIRLSKIGEIPIAYHRPIPTNAIIKQVCIKRDSSGKWHATFGIEIDDKKEKPPTETIELESAVGIDLGILNFSYDSDGLAVKPLNLSEGQERLRREKRNLSRKEKGSKNYKEQRRVVANCYEGIANKRRDFLHKLALYYVENYQVLAIEDLDIECLKQEPMNSQKISHSAWRTFIELLRYKAESAGAHIVEVNPRGTTMECSSCGHETPKPLWLREHSCDNCGYQTDRDHNAAQVILGRGLSELGMGQAESTPLETVTATATRKVSASRVIEQGSSISRKIRRG